MQYWIKQRATETGDITFDTPAIDVEGMPLLVFELIVYSIAGGGSEQIVAQLETGSDLLTWGTVPAADVTLAAADSIRNVAHATDRPYSRYVRFHVEITGSVTGIEYSLILDTYASS